VQIVECVPNFSEGRDARIIQAIRDVIDSTPGVAVLDVHTDPVHNRSVVTFAGGPDHCVEAAFRGASVAAERIDMRQHTGAHPRIGATDVVPFVPLEGIELAQCVELAEKLGLRLGADLGIPVYLYGAAARRPERAWLPAIRRGGYEGLVESIGHDPDREPDFGPRSIGGAGATAVGARGLLVAFNVNLATADLRLARDIARAIRQSSGGLPHVQARAMETADPDVVQVSMNLLDTDVTPLHIVFERVRALAVKRGVDVATSEVVGLLSSRVLARTFGHFIRVPGFAASGSLDHRLVQAMPRMLGHDS
jgi:glutamate formiminotransferase